jgi:hypothetical protein
MHTTHAVPLTVEPEAAALVAELGLQAPLEQMLEHARRTITGLQSLQVKFGPAYDTGEERIIIEAVRDPASRDSTAWTWEQFSRWKLSAFSPDVYRHFTLLDEYGTIHAG